MIAASQLARATHLPLHIENVTPAPAEKAAAYEARDVTREFDGGQVKALRGASFRVEEGAFVAISGPSGCGKSTLLQLLGGLDLPDTGTLMFRGQSLAEIPDLSVYRSRQIGFIFQSFHLLPTFTAVENVQIPMFETPIPRGERADRARELLNLVGLEHRIDHFPSKLSGGERQRVAIARSLANDPSVLLADEPTGNLDSKSAHHILDLLVRLQVEQGRTMIMVTHDLSIAERASKTLFMKDGQFVDHYAPALEEAE